MIVAQNMLLRHFKYLSKHNHFFSTALLEKQSDTPKNILFLFLNDKNYHMIRQYQILFII